MRSLALLGAVAVVAFLVGVAIAGLPTNVPSDVVGSEISPPPETAPGVGVASTSTAGPTDPTSSTVRREVITTTVPTTAAPTSTPPPSTIAATMTTTLAPVNTVRVVVGNAGPADGLAARTANTIRTFGYVDIAVTTAVERRPNTAVLFAPGREGEARALAAQLGVADTQVQARPFAALTEGDEQGDVWVLVGSDHFTLIQASQRL